MLTISRGGWRGFLLFAGINKIEGNLLIGKIHTGTVKEDTLTSIASLSSLKEVTGKVTINPTYGEFSSMVSKSGERWRIHDGYPFHPVWKCRNTKFGEIDLSHLKRLVPILSFLPIRFIL